MEHQQCQGTVVRPVVCCIGYGVAQEAACVRVCLRFSVSKKLWVIDTDSI